MRRRGNITSSFVFFLLLSFFFYVLFQTGIGKSIVGLTEYIIRPIRVGAISVYAATTGGKSETQHLEDRIKELEAKIVSFQEQEKEVRALRDQFSLTTPNPRTLLPAKIVGMKAFLPGYSLPEQIVIDKGERDGVKEGSVIVYKNNLIGKVSSTRQHVSVVDLSFKQGFSITAATVETNALGVAKGQGEGELLLDNVVLSDTLKKGDTVTTKGSTNSEGVGADTGLIIGKLISVDKKPSALFQTAKLERPVDITRLTMVFVQL